MHVPPTPGSTRRSGFQLHADLTGENTSIPAAQPPADGLSEGKQPLLHSTLKARKRSCQTPAWSWAPAEQRHAGWQGRPLLPADTPPRDQDMALPPTMFWGSRSHRVTFPTT